LVELEGRSRMDNTANLKRTLIFKSYNEYYSKEIYKEDTAT